MPVQAAGGISACRSPTRRHAPCGPWRDGGVLQLFVLGLLLLRPRLHTAPPPLTAASQLLGHREGDPLLAFHAAHLRLGLADVLEDGGHMSLNLVPPVIGHLQHAVARGEEVLPRQTRPRPRPRPRPEAEAPSMK
jgi:hypothetical protein